MISFSIESFSYGKDPPKGQGLFFIAILYKETRVIKTQKILKNF